MPTNQTLGFIGCGKKHNQSIEIYTKHANKPTGNMGGAVLHGILNSAFPASPQTQLQETNPPITHFKACTKTASSATRLRDTIPSHNASQVEIVSGENVQTMRDADVIILGCKPFMAEDVLGAEGVREALAGKLVISMLAGQSVEQLLNIIRGSASEAESEESVADPIIMKAIPNMGAAYQTSMTIIEEPAPTTPPAMISTTEWIFNQVGKVKYLPDTLMGLGTVLVGAAIAALTVPIEGLLDGCVAEGMRRGDAMEIVLQGIRGLSSSLEDGTHPAVLRESISSPRGCTIQALLALERKGTRSDFSDAIVEGNKHLREKM
jgi:pyrroline-5-carboxylate reductase